MPHDRKERYTVSLKNSLQEGREDRLWDGEVPPFSVECCAPDQTMEVLAIMEGLAYLGL